MRRASHCSFVSSSSGFDFPRREREEDSRHRSVYLSTDEGSSSQTQTSRKVGARVARKSRGKPRRVSMLRVAAMRMRAWLDL